MKVPMKIYLLILFTLVFINSCFPENKDIGDEAISQTLEYIKNEDFNFKNKFKVPIFVYFCNKDILNNERRGNFMFNRDRFESEVDMVFFSDLSITDISNDQLIHSFGKFIPKNMIIFINSENEYNKTVEYLKSQKGSQFEKKWMFRINGFRRNEKYAALQIHYMADLTGYLGCEIVYSYVKKKIINKYCELPYKEK